RSLCKDGAEATDAGVLAHLVATQLRRLIELESVAVYECHGDSFIPISIDSLNQSPAIPFVALSKNDQAILRITSQPSATEMIGIETALPSNSIAFPMVAGGRLIGVVVCMRQQALTYYDRDVRRMVERFVCTIGSMLVFLRSRYCERYPEPRVRSHRSSRAAFAGAASDPR
ncbi:MAG: GAF domain-containing protein, partial [Candidatus Eremiobacteraeota bacterium]|nr:GAF domain-containing protein [Candidatus Eremiobacteraeota bacterium]